MKPQPIEQIYPSILEILNWWWETRGNRVADLKTVILAYRNRDKKRVGRNESCPCGSGRKFKKCCMNK